MSDDRIGTTPASPTREDDALPVCRFCDRECIGVPCQTDDQAGACQNGAPSPVARGEWLVKLLTGFRVQDYQNENDTVALTNYDANCIASAIMRHESWNVSSPPAVVGKPTRDFLGVTIFTHSKPDLPMLDSFVLADALLAAPIWPSAEPPAPTSMDASDAAIFDSALMRSSKVVAEPPATVDAEVEEIAALVARAAKRPDDWKHSYGAELLEACETLLTKLRQRTGSGITREDEYARGIETAAAHAASFPAHQCGHLPPDPFECAAQVAREIASGIRALLPAPSEGVK